MISDAETDRVPTGATPDFPPTGPGGPDAGGEGDGARPKPLLLLIEDDWRTHSALRKIFNKLGWEVYSAMTVSGGLALLEHGPMAVVLDMMLPDGDGLAVLRKIRSAPSTIRVVVATGIEDPRRLEEIRRLQPAAILHKPLELADLLRVLDVDLPA